MIGKSGSTYLDELDMFGTKMLGNKFHGVYPSDKIPKLTTKQPYCILNLDKSTQSGSHWIGVARTPAYILVYDSFGRKTKRILPALFKNSGKLKIVDTEADPEQDILEENCGQRCLSWLILLDNYGLKMANEI